MAVSDARIVELPRVFDLDALDGVRDRLLEVIDVAPVRVLGASVERVATNAVLMLLAAASTAERNGVSLALSEPSQPLQTAAFRPLVEG
jgi:hypothetical protein